MAIRAIVFDIGGVLEVTPPTGWVARWERQLQLEPGTLETKLGDVWRSGRLGTISESEVEQRIGAALAIDQQQVAALMHDVWDDYLGQPNRDLLAYFASLRPRYRTALLSNSFVGARAKEQERYQFGDLCDLIVYSYEEGIEKPDERIFLRTCEHLDIETTETVFLDDFEPHIRAARSLGIHGVVFQSTAQAIAEIESIIQAESFIITNQPTLRRATRADIEAVTRLTEAAYTRYVALLGREPQPMTTNYEPFVAEQLVWLLETQHDVVGVLVLEHQPDALLIYSVAVSPNHQKHGFGRQLLAKAEHEALRSGHSRIRLYTNALMEYNIALYTSLGYHETRREPYSGGAVVHMTKELVQLNATT